MRKDWSSLVALYLNILGAVVIGWFILKITWDWIIVELFPEVIALPWATLPKVLVITVLLLVAVFLWPWAHSD